MIIRTYETERDREAVKQLWTEVGWGDYKEEQQQYLETERTIVAESGARILDVVDVGKRRKRRKDLRYCAAK